MPWFSITNIILHIVCICLCTNTTYNCCWYVTYCQFKKNSNYILIALEEYRTVELKKMCWSSLYCYSTRDLLVIKNVLCLEQYIKSKNGRLSRTFCNELKWIKKDILFIHVTVITVTGVIYVIFNTITVYVPSFITMVNEEDGILCNRICPVIWHFHRLNIFIKYLNETAAVHPF